MYQNAVIYETSENIESMSKHTKIQDRGNKGRNDGVEAVAVRGGGRVEVE
jgi:hypothetical protein